MKKVVKIQRADIYQKVADKVNIYLDTNDYPKSFSYKDSEGIEHNISTSIEARSLKGNITRSIVKRNTMTVPYSVTFRGMQDQLRAELEDLKFSGKQFWDGELWVVVRLLATLNHRAIYETVKGARLGQEYLKEVSKLTDEVASWVTPIYGLPVMQPSYKMDITRVNTLMGKLSVQYFTDRLDTRSQSNSIAPNVIHSLDSTILFGAVDRGPENIGTIHDCFLVHPNNWRDIQDAFRESYVELMMAEPLKFIGHQIDKEQIIEVPNMATLDLNEVLKSKYIIS